eukprot:TRINITY_DN401_c0_g1_i1.p2 TRINITY_DN401_c0_g1~~TRINITY_DN401_c0_g1_i1.p2  ORF type:complete len:274 (-),score=160.39 TRINITY_DN401_c0_g1_i1:78-899(-)
MSKKGAGGGGKDKKAIKKVVEDKTFGMKNKNKSKKIQKFVATVEKSASVGAKGGKKGPELSEWDIREAKKKAKEAEKLEMFLLGGDTRKKGGKDDATVAQLAIVEPEEPEEEEIDPELPIEEQIEIRRSRIKVHTPLTLQLFLDWKERKRLEKERQENEQNKRRKADITSGKVQRSGRELFEDSAAQYEDDEEAVVAEEYITNEDETEAGFEISATGTSITLKEVAGVAPKSLIVEDAEGSSSSSSSAPAGADVPVDAALFDDAGLDDLDDLE